MYSSIHEHCNHGSAFGPHHNDQRSGEAPTEVDQKVELSRNFVAAPADTRGFPGNRPNRGYRQRKTAPQNGAAIARWSPVERGEAGNEIRLRVYECSALLEYGSSTQAKPSTLTTSTLAIFA